LFKGYLSHILRQKIIVTNHSILSKETTHAVGCFAQFKSISNVVETWRMGRYNGE